ncbi:MAG: type II secretion system protein E [Deltaproteobacteria bacterium CG17_big_fil_post_rev_8_21_14_2_50_63_7]|nr:MAG: type II secretion system protein E [Deltaproteobacteria bacterium CG17_big_fil_post_rev_8_21_14_2_50_63_7]
MSIAPADLNIPFLCTALEKHNLITDTQSREIKVKEGAVRARLLKDLGSSSQRVRTVISAVDVLVALELQMPDGRRLSEDRIREVVASEANLPYLKVDPLKLDAKLITETFSRPYARHNIVLPVQKDLARIVVAISDPFNVVLLDSLKRTLPLPPEFVLTSKSDILKIITEVYGFRSSVKAAVNDQKQAVDLGNLERYVSLSHVDELEADDAHVVNAVEYLLHYAFEQRASDIHIEPKREYSIIRMRIDGILHQVYQLPKAIHPPFVSRIKMLASMDIAEKRRPQDGRIKTELQGKETELRVSSMPVAFGEKVVIRIFDPQHLLQDLSSIGMHSESLQRYEGFLSNSTGLILVTGPTGSGKTTTLYSTLRYLAGPDVNITTAEDPIEMVYEPFNQVQIQPKIGVTFPSALRTILRQDPDIIMVGEIRDEETASMAVQAALTGHLVFSTLHTNDAPTTITRLLDLGVKPFLLSSVLIGVVAQRLLRSICPDCKATTAMTDDQIAALDLKLPSKQKRRLPIRFGKGCSTCRFTGLMGRSAVFEVMAVTESIRKLITLNADAEEIMKAARADGTLTLREAAIRKMAQGETTFEEVFRVLGTG